MGCEEERERVGAQEVLERRGRQVNLLLKLWVKLPLLVVGGPPVHCRPNTRTG